MSAALTTAVIETDAGLAELEEQWWQLWAAGPSPLPFTSPAWLLPWWDVFRPGRLRVATVRSGDRLVGLAPFYLEDGRLGRRLLPLGIGISDRLDLLVSADGDPAVGAALLRALTDHAADWDSLELEELGADGAALALTLPPGCRETVSPQSASPVLRLDRPDDVPSRKRRKLRMAGHRTERRGGIVEHVAPDGAGAFLDELARLHGSRWHARGEAGVLADDPVLRFHAASLPRLAAAGVTRLFRLVIEGRVAGAYYGLFRGERAYAYLGGFDPDFAFESPGTVLLGHAIEDARAGGATVFDFLRGQEPYKYEWGATDTWSRRRSVTRLG